jgi:hypothetical protein
MGARKTSKAEVDPKDDPVKGRWPGWAQSLVSALLIFHGTALLGAVVGGGTPASDLEMSWARLFRSYYDLMAVGYPYRYYAPEPPPTPVVEATLHFKDGRADEKIRLPNRKARPLLRYQRQLALAYHLTQDFEEKQAMTGDGRDCHVGRSYGRHLCITHPDCERVSFYILVHRIPDLLSARAAMAAPGAGRFDADAEEFYEAPVWIGDFACDGSSTE